MSERKYVRCPERGLDIRCGDVEKRKAGYHHKRRKATLLTLAALTDRTGKVSDK